MVQKKIYQCFILGKFIISSEVRKTRHYFYKKSNGGEIAMPVFDRLAMTNGDWI